ncbi:hypothetical protein EVAR_99863_1 [Eumeta japonica]|uniref:Uncharacterized protein n=1 Tax=Eumeta variegata TaxID=151549 RepID=A0A4C1ZI75_EUMVA|nr:hypothetical protein EVAR_99863_1 [Eumeta japonica]
MPDQDNIVLEGTFHANKAHPKEIADCHIHQGARSVKTTNTTSLVASTICDESETSIVLFNKSRSDSQDSRQRKRQPAIMERMVTSTTALVRGSARVNIELVSSPLTSAGHAVSCDPEPGLVLDFDFGLDLVPDADEIFAEKRVL